MAQSNPQTQISKALDAYQAACACAGDEAAFSLLYKRWHGRLLRFAYRQTGHPEAARDVMQEAALSMARNIHRLKDPELFSSWAYTIVRRRAADHIAANIKDRALKASYVPDEAINMSGQTERDLALKQGLAQLPEEQRLLLTLFYVEGLTGAELSAAMGLPIGTIKSRLFAAREHLKSIYDTPPSNHPSKGDDHD